MLGRILGVPGAWFAALVLCTSALCANPLAAKAPTAVASAAPIHEEVDEASPRAALTEFLRLAAENRYDEAARYLDVPKARSGEGPRLARRLKAVLDRHIWIDLETISREAPGSLKDGLLPAYEQVGQIPFGRRAEPVRLFRRAATGGTPAWVFSRTTVEHVDAWYLALDHRFVLEKLPPWLQRPGPKGLLLWQWIALPMLGLVGLLIGAVLSRLTRRLLVRIVARTPAVWDDTLAIRLRGPLTLFYGLLLVALSLPWLGLYRPAAEFTERVLGGLALFGLFWAASRMVEIWGLLLIESRWGRENQNARALAPFGIRLVKVAVLVIAVIVFVAALGYSPTSLIAGLGVGGLAIALAGQKTVENLFGAVALSVDQPFRVGDFIKLEDVLGTVEVIGLRSTRIRTPDRTLVSIPNGRLSEMRLENFGARDRIRLPLLLGLVYGTTASQVQEVLTGLTELLRAHPKLWPENVDVYLKELGSSALVIEVNAWFVVENYAEFQVIRQELLLGILRVVETAGTSLAFPTTTVQVKKEG